MASTVIRVEEKTHATLRAWSEAQKRSIQYITFARWHVHKTTLGLVLGVASSEARCVVSEALKK